MAEPQFSPRTELWKLSQNLLSDLADRFYQLPAWDDHAAYVAAQLNTIGLLSVNLHAEEDNLKTRRVMLGSSMFIRTIQEAVEHALAGINDAEFAKQGFEEVKKWYLERTWKKQDFKDRLKAHKITAGHALDVQRLGNAILHCDADASFLMRKLELHGDPIKALWLSLVELQKGLEPYMASKGIAFTAEEAASYTTRAEAISTALDNEKPHYLSEFEPFENRVYAELVKRGARITVRTI